MNVKSFVVAQDSRLCLLSNNFAITKFWHKIAQGPDTVKPYKEVILKCQIHLNAQKYLQSKI